MLFSIIGVNLWSETKDQASKNFPSELRYKECVIASQTLQINPEIKSKDEDFTQTLPLGFWRIGQLLRHQDLQMMSTTVLRIQNKIQQLSSIQI